MEPATDESAIKLHTDKDGVVWYAAGIYTARSSGQVADTFLLSSVLPGMGARVRILGVPENAELITALYLRRRKSEVHSVEVAGPNICESPEELNDPELVLHRMRATALTAACGGWHLLSDADYFTYALIARMRRNHDAFDSSTAAYLQAHPLYRPLSYIPTLSALHLAKLVKTVVDPRWYVDRRAPERQGKLELFLGLTPAVQARVSDTATLIHRPRDLRCSLVLDAWKSVKPDAVDLNDPRNFLYRVQKSCGGGARGDLRASQAFVRYLRYNWLDSIDRRQGAKDGLFMPEMFFKTPAERESFALHMAS